MEFDSKHYFEDTKGTNQNNYKRDQKRKVRSNKYLKNAKGFEKRGVLGRGTEIDRDQGSYFVNILDVLRKGFETLEDKLNLATNVLEQTENEEIKLASNQIGCRVIENLLGYAEPLVLERYHKIFAENFRPICTDSFASHVLEQIIQISSLRSFPRIQNEEQPEPAFKIRKVEVPDEEKYNLTTEFTDEHTKACREFVIRASKFLLNNLEDFVWDSHANHLIRTSMTSLVGIYVHKNKAQRPTFKKPSDIIKSEDFEMQEEYVEILNDYATRLQMWPQFSEFPYSELTSGLLQALCTSLKRCNKNMLKSLGKKILNTSFIEESAQIDDKKEVEIRLDEAKTETPVKDLPRVFTTEPSIRLLETLIAVAGPKLFTQLYAKLFIGRLIELSEMASVNFSVQKLIDNCKEKTEFEAIADEIVPGLENLLRIGHTGLVSSLAEACKRVNTKQNYFVQGLQLALHCSTQDRQNHFVGLVLKLKPYELAEEDKSHFIHIHGSLIVQSMLHFQRPMKVVQSLLNMSNIDLAALFSKPNGSHIADTYLQSKTVGEKSREKLIKHLMGTYLDIAITKNGSRAIESIFEAAAPQLRSLIIKELGEKVNQLKSTPFGRIIASKLRVDMYKTSTSEWHSNYNKTNKVGHLFKDILK